MIIENIKNYFAKKSENKETTEAPKGVCPACWGRQEWDGQFYKLMKAKNVTPKSDIYNNFVKEFVTKHIDGIVLKKDTYTCTTCNKDYKE